MSGMSQDAAAPARSATDGRRGSARDLRVLPWRGPLAAALSISLGIAALSYVMPIALGLTWDDWQHSVRGWFDVGNEGNLPTWWNTTLLIAAATLSAAAAVLHRIIGDASWSAWAGLAAVVALLSLDEAAGLHERLRFLSDAVLPQHGFTYSWLVVGIPLGIAVLAAVVLLGRRIERTSRRLFVLGLAVLLAGAVGLETANDLLMQARGGALPEGGSLVFHTIYHLEELLELIGASLLLAAPLASLRVEAADGGLRLRGR